MRRTPLGQIRALTLDRARGRCEMVNEYGIRCRNTADELHHRLPRRPGGTILDGLAVAALSDGTFDASRHLAHLLVLCWVCHHGVAHGQPERAAGLGLRVLGEIRHERWSGETFYVGPDEEFAALWPREVAA